MKSLLSYAAALSLATALGTQASAATFETLYSFTNTSGARPFSNVRIDAQGNLFGTTTSGPNGNFGLGTVYRFGADGSMAILHSFDGADGQVPIGGLAGDPAGNMYGTTTGGGANGRGTIFRIDPNGNLATLHALQLSTGANVENAMISDASGNLYGVAGSGGTGGPYAGGTLFRYSSSGEYTVLHDFTSVFTAGVPIGSPVLDPFGNIYGTTVYGGIGGNYGNGTIFRLASDGTFSLVHKFDAINGALPFGRLVSDSQGNIFGTASQGGGSTGGGVIFKLALDGTYSVLHAFDSTAEGYYPVGGLTIDAAGNLFGSTSRGGANGDYGTLFRLSADGTFSTLHEFAGGSGGLRPVAYGWLEADSVGNLYGTTVLGGDFDYGTIFKLSDVGFVVPSVEPPVGGVPEPASWAMLIAGFGLTGAAMRRRRSAAVAA
jgi:uncharacterized repeat protein (TIGR03803 family)